MVISGDKQVTKEMVNRNVSFDLLRFFAAMMVVLLHVSAQNWYTVEPTSRAWLAMNLYDSMARSAVPLFFMLSGAFILKKDIPIKELYKKKIIPLGLIYIAWSVFYALCTIGINNISLSTMIDFSSTVVNSHYHLWFIPVLLGLYILQPILRGVVRHEDGHVIKYYLILFLVFGICRETLILFVSNPILLTIINKIPMDMVTYPGYMIIGYYLANVSSRRYSSGLLVWTFILSVAICTVIGQIMASKSGVASDILYGNFSITSFVEAVSFFMLFKNMNVHPRENIKKTIFTLSSSTFGIYLVHPLIISFLEKIFSLTTVSYNSFLAVPINTMLVVAIAFGTTFIMNKVPVIKWFWKL